MLDSADNADGGEDTDKHGKYRNYQNSRNRHYNSCFQSSILRHCRFKRFYFITFARDLAIPALYFFRPFVYDETGITNIRQEK